MIKVLVVDDDKLVRKGLISAMPWSEFRMEVVGEAGNGKKALELLGTEEVDLLLTDLAMPVMSGLELIRSAREHYPNLFFVVLTMHHDFEHIQEALRLGAIDYIAKYQLEKERFEEVLGRIHDRIVQERMKSERLRDELPYASVCRTDSVYVFLAKTERPEAAWLADCLAPYGQDLAEIELNAWIYVPEEEGGEAGLDASLASCVSDRPGWSVMKLTGIRGEKRSDVHHAVRHYMQREHFYDNDADCTLFARTLEQIRSAPQAVPDGQPAQMKEQWLSLGWVMQRASFERSLCELRRSRLPRQELMRLLTMIEDEWRRIYGAVAERIAELPNRLDNWREAERWLRSLQRAAGEAADRSSFSREVMNGIYAAVKIVHAELDQHLYAVDVARRVGISRSYFSQCFKEMTGQSFNDYLRSVRVEKAMEYLAQTRQPVQWIAERTGYLDDKYFSRVFRDKTGLLPSEYRARHGIAAAPDREA